MLNMTDACKHWSMCYEAGYKFHILSSGCFILCADELLFYTKLPALQLTAIKHDEAVNILAFVWEIQALTVIYHCEV